MVNNAGIETRTSVLDTTEDQYEKVLAINLKSAFFGTQIAAKQMIAQGGGGRIINMTSVHEDWPMPGNTAVLPLQGRHAHADPDGRRRVGAAQHLVVGVGPGAVDTPINAQTVANPRPWPSSTAAIPLGRLAEPEEIASVVAFLAGPGASYVTATTIFADGGIMQSSPGSDRWHDMLIVAGTFTVDPAGAPSSSRADWSRSRLERSRDAWSTP